MTFAQLTVPISGGLLWFILTGKFLLMCCFCGFRMNVPFFIPVSMLADFLPVCHLFIGLALIYQTQILQYLGYSESFAVMSNKVRNRRQRNVVSTCDHHLCCQTRLCLLTIGRISSPNAYILEAFEETAEGIPQMYRAFRYGNVNWFL
ncbi:hypothetical protein ABKN59_006267 [Abortiporus biennis]